LLDKPSKPIDIPAGPRRTYKDKGWISMGDWLGTKSVATRSRIYRGFEEARMFVRKLGLKSQSQWRLYRHGQIPGISSKPDDIPSNPERTYKNTGYAGMGDWLGTGNRRGSWRSFQEARVFVQSLRLKSSTEWKRYCKGELSSKPPKPDDIPSSPSYQYKEQGWIGMGDWLGTGTVATYRRGFWPFKKARAFVRNLKLKSQREWNLYCKGEPPGKPDAIPTNPHRSYKDEGWNGIADWLGE
jgi:hypothetical protein